MNMTNKNPNGFDNDSAANLIRSKLDQLYSSEPEISEEKEEITNTGVHSKHQKFVQSLFSSGRSYPDIQTAWHNYYISLPDNEKHEVWQEFYSLQNSQHQTLPNSSPSDTDNSIHKSRNLKNSHLHYAVKARKPSQRKVSEIKNTIANKISADGKLTTKHHLKSLLFGIAVSLGFAGIMGFTLFNQLFIAPFISPSINASASPIIIPSDGQANVSPEPKIIIPKLNVEAPIVTDAPDIQEENIQKALEKGVVLYPNTGQPGELGNQVFFGHSSNNLFNRGDYKYVFVLLGKLETGDVIYVNFNSKQYTYRVIDKRIIKPTQVEVLTEQPVPSLITLITCDPPGSNVNRLVVQAEQINPKVEENKPSTAKKSDQSPPVLAGSPESLLRRIWNSIF